MSLNSDIERTLTEMTETVNRGGDLLSQVRDQLTDIIDSIREQLRKEGYIAKSVMWRGNNLDEIKRAAPSWHDWDVCCIGGTPLLMNLPVESSADIAKPGDLIIYHEDSVYIDKDLAIRGLLFTGEENQFAEIQQKFPETKIAKAKLTLSDGNDFYVLIVLSDDAPETLLSETDYPKYVIDTIFPNRWIMEDPSNPKKFIRL